MRGRLRIIKYVLYTFTSLQKKRAGQIITHVNLENVLTGQEKIHELKKQNKKNKG
jgi:hypothetical protein